GHHSEKGHDDEGCPVLLRDMGANDREGGEADGVGPFSQTFAAEGDMLDEIGEDGRDCAEHQLDRVLYPPNGVSENDIPKRAATDARHHADEDDAEDIHT